MSLADTRGVLPPPTKAEIERNGGTMAGRGRPKVDPAVRAMQALGDMPEAARAIFQRAIFDADSNENKVLTMFRGLEPDAKTIVFNLMGVEMNKPEAA